MKNPEVGLSFPNFDPCNTSVMQIVKSDSSTVFERFKSNVRSYSSSFPAVMAHAQGAIIQTEKGRDLIDFLSGAGVLNYGHNPAALKSALSDYLRNDGIIHALDLWTPAKRRFIEVFNDIILAPRGIAYKYQFPGPTGANAIEAAFMLARKVNWERCLLQIDASSTCVPRAA